jgi:hypothetical protein
MEDRNFAASGGSHSLALQAKIKLWQENFVALDLAPGIKPRQLGFSTRSSTPLTPVKRRLRAGWRGRNGPTLKSQRRCAARHLCEAS